MKRVVCCFLLLGCLAVAFIGCAYRQPDQTDVVSAAEETTGASALTEQLPVGTFRQDAQLLSLEAAQADSRFISWLPAGRPFPEKRATVVYNEQFTYVNVIFFQSSDPASELYISIWPDSTAKQEPWNPAKLIESVQKNADFFSVALSLEGKAAYITSMGGDEQALLTAAQWLLQG